MYVLYYIVARYTARILVLRNYILVRESFRGILRRHINFHEFLCSKVLFEEKGKNKVQTHLKGEAVI